MPLSFMPPKGRSRQRGFGRDDALVGADDAVFEGLGDAPDIRNSAGLSQDVERQAVRGLRQPVVIRP
jgi:hypothetical protein